MAPPDLRSLKASKRDPRDIMKARIAKRSFIFDVRRFFNYNKTFKVQKAPTGLDAVKALAGTQFKSLSPRRGPQPSIPKLSSPPGMGNSILIAVILIALMIGAVILYAFISFGKARPVPAQLGSQSFSFTLSAPLLLSYGLGEDSVFYVPASVAVNGSVNASFLLRAFSSTIPTTIYLVLAPSQEATSLPAFEKALADELQRRGSSLRTISVDDMPFLTESEPAIFILPTGFMPSQLLGANGSTDFVHLVRNGSVLIYSGYELTSAITPTGDVVPSERLNVSVGGKYGLAFNKQAGQFKGLRATLPQYSVSSASRFAPLLTVFGSVYAYDLSPLNGSGYLVIIPQTLDGGWPGNGAAAAEDFMKLIDSVAWQAPIVKGALEAENITSGPHALLTEPAPGLAGRELYLHALATYTLNWSNYSQTAALGKLVDDTQGSSMRHAPSALQTSLTGERLAITATNLSDMRVAMRIEAFKDGFFKGAQDIGDVISRTQYAYSVDLEPGDYDLELKGPGGVYARSYLRVPQLSFASTDKEWDLGRLHFKVLADGRPMSSLHGVKASLDNKYSFDVSTSNGEFVLDIKEPLAPGAHTVTFDLGSYALSYDLSYVRTLNWWERWEYQLAIAASILLFYIGAVLRRPDKIMFSLDVPDFPPSLKTTIPISRQRVLALFSDVNKEYKWRYMPLSLVEIKNGFRRTMVRGRPLIIGDYNTERLMEQLEKRGDVVRIYDMYALRSWENESGRSARYLYIFRKMRDALVNIAVPFTEIGRSQDYDSLITLGDEQIAVHVYDGKREVSEIVAKAVKGASGTSERSAAQRNGDSARARERRQLILFASDPALDEFSEALDSTSKLFVSAKMQLQAGRIALTTIAKLAQFLKGKA